MIGMKHSRRGSLFSIAGGVFVGLVSLFWITRDRLSDISERLPGSTTSDSGFLAGRFASLRDAGLTPITPARLVNIGWPYGVENRAHINWTAPLSVMTNFLFFSWAGPTANQVFFAVTGVLFTAAAVSYVTFRLSGSWYAGLLAAFFAAISSPMLHWAQEAPNYTYIGIVVLFHFSLSEALRQNSKRLSVLSGVLGLVATLWLQYFALFVGLIIAAHTISMTLSRQQVRNKALLTTLAIWLPGFVPYLVVKFGFSDAVPTRTSSEAVARSLSISSALTPSSYLYIGGILTISMVALSVMYLKHETRSMDTAISSFLRATFLTVFLAALFLGPSSAGLIPLPGKLIPILIPQFRHGMYSAHLIQSFFSVCMATFIIVVSKSTIIRLALICPILIFGALDGMRINRSGGDRLLNQVTQESAITVLAGMPRGPVANFPWELSSEFGSNSDATPCLRQAVTHMPVVNVCDYDEPATPLIRKVRKAGSCSKLEILREAGVRYVIVDFTSVQPQLSTCLINDAGVRQLAASGDVTVWQLTKSD
jgi:hypothetical protein